MNYYVLQQDHTIFGDRVYGVYTNREAMRQAAEKLLNQDVATVEDTMSQYNRSGLVYYVVHDLNRLDQHSRKHAIYWNVNDGHAYVEDED